MKQTINHNSSVNQDIKRKFVDREVIILASDIVDEFQKINPSWFEDWDIRNLYFYPCPECGGSMEERAVKWVCNNCKHRQTEEPEQEMQEIYEYWFVAKWLAEKLEEKGEVIIYHFNSPIWGRQASGQAILLDGVISEICEDLEILDGQRYSWK